MSASSSGRPVGAACWRLPLSRGSYDASAGENRCKRLTSTYLPITSAPHSVTSSDGGDVMQRVFDRPKVVYVALVVAIVAFFALSAVGNSGTDAQNKASGVTWIGNIGWAMFLISILATILYTVALVVRTLVRRR